jgi:uncharacterized membrane protein YoaK (UPF0700 family)
MSHSRSLDELREVLIPSRTGRHGPLPPLLVGLTVVTGLVDAFSYLLLGHVFVANMTGNVVFIGFALAGAKGLSVGASLAAAGAFLAGSVAGGRIGVHYGAHRGRLLRIASATGAPLMLVAVLIAALAGQPVSTGPRYALIVTLATAMGLQNAVARRLAVPDLTTTVLTLTLTGLAADSKLAGGPGGHPARRLIAVGAMFTGALVGALLVVHVDLILPLACAAVLLAAAGLITQRISYEDAEWARPPGQGG